MAAIRFGLIHRSILLVVCLIGAGGCASSTMLVSDLPPPNFNGPTIASRQSTPTVAYVPRPIPSSPRPGVPAGWIPTAPTRQWKWIVIHHSATSDGSASVFDRMHRDKGWDELGYHFVIGNGSRSGNGAVEVGGRWSKQKWGAHAKTPDNKFNDYGIGICLVGNFDETRPTAQQMQAVSKLVAYLMKTYRISSNNVIGHGSTPGGTVTACPGRNMNIAQIRKLATQTLAEADSGERVSEVAGTVNPPADGLLVTTTETTNQ